MSKNYLKEDATRRLEVLCSLGVKEDDLKRDVDIFRSWAVKQKHLPQDFLYGKSSQKFILKIFKLFLVHLN